MMVNLLFVLTKTLRNFKVGQTQHSTVIIISIGFIPAYNGSEIADL